MRTLIKRIVIWMYQRGWTSMQFTQQMFDLFKLGSR